MEQNKRLLSIDAFRGLTIALMILVNMPGSWDYVYPPLDHAKWFGWTPTDLVFPWFLFICGVSMVFSFGSRGSTPVKRTKLYRHIVIRSVLIFFIGLLLNFFPAFDLASLRYSGVLQRIGLTYLLAAPIYLHTNSRQLSWISVIILLGYWGLMSWVPVPGYSVGDLSAEGNVAGWLDRLLLGAHGRAPTDPEGILSTLPAVVSVLAGCLVGTRLRSVNNKNDNLGWMFFGGWVLILIGLVWSIWFPISKKLWSSSYVVFTTGAALQLLAVCYWLIEIKGYKKWAKPAIIYGSNALAAYVFHIFAIRLLMKAVTFTDNAGLKTNAYNWIWQNAFVPWAGEWLGSLAFAIFNVFFWLGILTLLYRKRIFIKV